MAYSHDYYMKHKESYKRSQKKYYEANKDKIRAKYRHHRKLWNAIHQDYISEHARLNRQLKKAQTIDELQTIEVMMKKDYLRDLHKRGMI